MSLRLLIALTLVGLAAASCPDDCSGHGACARNDKCSCYSNWEGIGCGVERESPPSPSPVVAPCVDTRGSGSGAHGSDTRGTYANGVSTQCEYYKNKNECGLWGGACQKTCGQCGKPTGWIPPTWLEPVLYVVGSQVAVVIFFICCCTKEFRDKYCCCICHWLGTCQRVLCQRVHRTSENIELEMGETAPAPGAGGNNTILEEKVDVLVPNPATARAPGSSIASRGRRGAPRAAPPLRFPLSACMSPAGRKRLPRADSLIVAATAEAEPRRADADDDGSPTIDADVIVGQMQDAFAKAGSDTALLVAACRLIGSLADDNRHTLSALDLSHIQKCLIAEARTARSRAQADKWMESGVATALGNALRVCIAADGASQEEKRQQSDDIVRQLSL